MFELEKESSSALKIAMWISHTLNRTEVPLLGRIFSMRRSVEFTNG